MYEPDSLDIAQQINELIKDHDGTHAMLYIDRVFYSIKNGNIEYHYMEPGTCYKIVKQYY